MTSGKAVGSAVGAFPRRSYSARSRAGADGNEVRALTTKQERQEHAIRVVLLLLLLLNTRRQTPATTPP